MELNQKNLCCSICLDLLKDPVTISCGHSYCRSCTKSYRDGEDQKESHSCPQCRQSFSPLLVKNTMSTDLVEELKKTGLQAAPGPGNAACDVTAAESEARASIQDSLSEDEAPISLPGTEADALMPQEEPKTRAEFLQYACQITMDPNTANTRILLSEGNRKATNMAEDQVYLCHPDRFMDGSLVLSRESLTGRCYWEVERSKGAVSVAVTYKNISKTGTESVFGFNDKSWAIDCFDNRYVVRHVNIIAANPHRMSSRVGVYLDHRAGILSFYSISDTMTLLHRVQTTFTQPLYAGLWVHGYKSVAEVCCTGSG